MSISKRIHDALNQQVQKEFHSEYLYLSMASYFASIDLPGFSNFFKVQALEEREHAMKFFTYLCEKGERVLLQPIEEPKHAFASPMEALQEALMHEEQLTQSIHEIVELSIHEKDYATQTFLHWFVNEQVEEVASISAWIGKLKWAVNDGAALLFLDSELEKRGIER